MSILVIHQPNFLPYLGFFEQLSYAHKYVAYDNVQFTEREFQNRNFIKGPAGKTHLTLPVAKKGRLGQMINQVEIADERWATTLTNRLFAFYQRAPFFREVIADLEPILATEYRLMAALNVDLLKLIITKLEIEVEFFLSSAIAIEYEDRVDRLFKLLEAVGADELLIGTGGASYLDRKQFEAKGFKLSVHEYRPEPYPQQYGDFIPYLSVIDYAMNNGWNYWK